MQLTPDEVEAYCLSVSEAESSLLKKIRRETHAQVLLPRMLSGPLQGALLRMLSRMMRPAKVLEIGTFTGYATLCLLEGLADDGRLVTLDRNEELEDRVRGYFAESPRGHLIDYRLGNALDLIPTLEGPFDIVFLDADKKNYPRYLEMVIPLMHSGSLLISDNVLWSGKVLGPEQAMDLETRILHQFNQSLAHDPRFQVFLMPLRDGLSLARMV